MKRILSAFIVLSMLLSVIPITTNMVYASEYNGFTYTIDNNQVKITKGATNTTDIIIPSEIEGYPVTEIGKGAFNNYTNITSVKIPNTVNTIGYGAFYGCIGLTDITIPESVTTIDHMAFQHCSNLENVTMLNGVKFIGQQVFLYCQKLKTLTLPVSIKTIQKESFYDCKNLKSVYYSGSPTDFSKIEIGANNNYLTNANITYNYIYPVVFEISDASGAPGENVIIDVNIPSNSQVCSGRFDLVYDNTKIDIISASAGTLISNPTINQNYAANKIRIVFVGITPLTDAGSILSVEFKIKDSATGQADLALENLKVSDVTASLLNSIATNNSITINEHTHAWGAWNITKKPTQTETGTAERICGNDSSHKETATLPKLTDSSVWTIGTYVAPTCESAGSQEYTSTYGTVTETIPATGHAWGAWNITKKPTQTETGTAERICGNDSSHKETDTLPVLTDTTVWTKGTYSAPTCEGAGSQEYTSAYGTVTETIPATGHAWGAWSITTKPTQTETGTAERICNNDSSHKDTATLPVLTDASVWTIGTYIAPTCEGTGSQEYTSIYGKVVETIPATEHAWGAWNLTVNPTKTETGTAERICGNDSSHKETATLPKLTDSSVWTIGTYVAPTCEGTGSQEYISSVYGTVTEIIPATGHAWGEWTITKEPTQTETGTAERICSNDSSHKDTATLPVLTDATVWTKGAYAAPTCENTGSQEYTSAYGTVVEIISALGHSFNILQHDDTKHWYKCERCTAINNEENHTGGQATKTERAVCSVCNTPYGKLLPNYVLPTDLKTTYGKTLSDIILPAGWKWTDSSIIPTVINNGYEAYYTIDNDTDYDWTKENGYDASVNQIKLNLTVNVEKAEQDISYAINSINKYTTDSAFTNELTKNIVQGALSFSSSNENVAIVDNNGLVTIKGAGTAIITATVSETENYKGRSASYTINVTRYSSHSGGGGSSTSYTISFDTNGGTQIDSVRVRRNGLLKEPERPVKAGYMFDGWYSDKELSVKYEFASKVTKSFTLYAKWHEEKSDNNHSGISDWENPFKDVHKNDWFYDSVKYVYINGMMKGVASDLFAPDGNITRAMFITVLYRIENEPDTECDNSFNDVEANSYYEKAVYWGRKNGIVKGITNTEYAPDLNITREQMAAMIYRYMTYKNMDLSVGENTNILSYADCSNISDYAIPAMQYAIGSGIIKGMTDNTLEPQGISTRAQAATVFMRTFKLLKK